MNIYIIILFLKIIQIMVSVLIMNKILGALFLITIGYILLIFFIPYISLLFYYIWKIGWFFMLPIHFINNNLVTLPDYLFRFMALIPFFIIWYIIFKLAFWFMTHSK